MLRTPWRRVLVASSRSTCVRMGTQAEASITLQALSRLRSGDQFCFVWLANGPTSTVSAITRIGQTMTSVRGPGARTARLDRRFAAFILDPRL
jgi:hypothetical protein